MPHSFAKSVLTVAGGSAVAQFITLLSLPLITRLFAPADYGYYVIFLAWGGFLAPVISGRFEVAIVLPKRDGSAAALAMGSLAIVVALSSLAAMAILLAGAAGLKVHQSGLVHLPLYVLSLGCVQVFTNLAIREKGYRRLSLSRILQALSSAAGMLIGGSYYSAEFTTLVFATIAGQLVGLCVLLGGVAQPRALLRVNRRQVVRLLKHYRKLAFFNVPHVLSDAAQGSGLPLLIGVLFGPQVTAYYSFAIRLLKAPLGLISSAVSQVYYPNAAAARNEVGKLRREAKRILLVMSTGVIPILLVVLLVPDAAYTAVFGPKWEEIGTYVKVLSPWALAAFVASPLTVVFLVKERFGLHFAFAVAGTVIAFMALWVADLASAAATTAMALLSFAMTAYVIGAVLLEFAVVLREDAPNGK